MPKINIAAIAPRVGSGYPEAFRAAFASRERRRLGDAAGLKQFGVNLTRIPPGSGTALRHWHEEEDEFVYVLEGELVLIDEDGEHRLHAGDAAGFPHGVANGHCLVNRSTRDAVLLEIGTRAARERAHYPDHDLAVTTDEDGTYFTHKDGSPY